MIKVSKPIKRILTDMLIIMISGITSALVIFVLTGVFTPAKLGKGETTEDRIRRLTASLQEAAQLINNIESEMTARSVLAEKLQKDIETYNKLVELKKPEVEAVAQLLRGELKREGRRSFWTSLAMNFLFVALGVIGTVITEKIVKRRTRI